MNDSEANDIRRINYVRSTNYRINFAGDTAMQYHRRN